MVGFFSFDARHRHPVGIRQPLCLFGGLFQGFLQGFGGGGQAVWLSFCSLRHVMGSVTVSLL